jgi:hypothetical protein
MEYLALPCSGLAVAVSMGNRDQLHDRLLPTGDDDFFTAAGFFDELGKLGFCFVDGDGFHT